MGRRRRAHRTGAARRGAVRRVRARSRDALRRPRRPVQHLERAQLRELARPARRGPGPLPRPVRRRPRSHPRGRSRGRGARRRDRLLRVPGTGHGTGALPAAAPVPSHRLAAGARLRPPRGRGVRTPPLRAPDRPRSRGRHDELAPAPGGGAGPRGGNGRPPDPDGPPAGPLPHRAGLPRLGPARAAGSAARPPPPAGVRRRRAPSARPPAAPVHARRAPAAAAGPAAVQHRHRVRDGQAAASLSRAAALGPAARGAGRIALPVSGASRGYVRSARW